MQRVVRALILDTLAVALMVVLILVKVAVELVKVETGEHTLATAVQVL
jgi:hypothetical protein